MVVAGATFSVHEDLVHCILVSSESKVRTRFVCDSVGISSVLLHARVQSY